MQRFLVLYIQDNEGAGTVDFVAMSFTMFLILFFIIEMILMYFNIQSAQKAAQIGARIAVVSDSMVAGLPARNGLVGGQVFGTSCSETPTPCADFGTLICSGTSCETVPFTRLLARMQTFLPNLQAGHVSVGYSYAGLGYAGGPVIPVVTIRINNVPYNTGVLGRILGAAGGDLSTLPAVSVRLTGEDLSQSGT